MKTLKKKWCLGLGWICMLCCLGTHSVWAQWSPTSSSALPIESASVVAKDHVTVTEDVITLGDVFEKLPSQVDAYKAIAKSPLPGEVATISVYHLSRIALENGLHWAPGYRKNGVEIKRAGQYVSIRDLNEWVRDFLKNHHDTGLDEQSFDIEWGVEPKLVLPTDVVRPQFGVLRFDSVSKQFRLQIQHDRNKEQWLVGKVIPMIKIPVFSVQMTGGEVINPSHIEWMDWPESKIKKDWLMDPQQAIGKAVRQNTQAKTPLAINQIQSPMWVKKNAMVQVVFESPMMQLSAQVKALDSGVQGEWVRLMNPSSNQIIRGEVIGENKVRVYGTPSVGGQP